MVASIVCFLIGIVCIILGISHRKGNISSLHSYHTHRVSEEDKLPLGKQVGLGTILVGIGIIAFSILSAITLYTENSHFISAGTAIMILSILAGLFIALRAIAKYNKGIF